MWKTYVKERKVEDTLKVIQFTGDNFVDIAKALDYGDSICISADLSDTSGYKVELVEHFFDSSIDLNVGDYIIIYDTGKVEVKTAHWFNTKYKEWKYVGTA